MATIDDLLASVDSKYTLVHLAAKRAREINNYYHSLGEGLGQYVRPLVDNVDSNKPLSIAMEEISQGKVVVTRSGEGRGAGDDDRVGIEGEDALLLDEDDVAALGDPTADIDAIDLGPGDAEG